MNALHFLRRAGLGFALFLGLALGARAGQYVSITSPASVAAGTPYEVDAWGSAGFGANIGIYLYKDGALVGSAGYYVAYYSPGDSGPRTVYYVAQFEDTYYPDVEEAWVQILASAPTTFSVNGFTYDGTPKTVTITPNPANATFTAGGTRTATTAGTYTATATATGSFSGSNSNLTWTISKATPTITWSVPSSMSYGTPLPAATANIPGTFSYSANPSPGTIYAGTVLNAGGYVLTATFTPSDTTNYSTATKSVTVAVGQVGTAVILSDLMQNHDGYGKSVTVTTIPNGLATSVEYYDTNRNQYIYSPSCPSNVGQYEVVATITDPNYTGQSNSEIMKILPQVSYNPQVTLTYGTPLNASQLGVSANCLCDYSYSINMGSVLGVGDYSLSVTITPRDAPAASVTRNVGIRVNPAPLTITANNASRVYGAANPTFSFYCSGLVNGESVSVVSGVTCGCSASPTSAAGTTWAITPSGGTASNYTISYVPGTLSITRATQAALAFTATSTQTYNTSQTLSASGGSGTGAFSYSIVGQSTVGVATLTGAVLTANSGTGWVDVQATRASDTNFEAVNSTTIRVALQQAAQAALAFAPVTTQTYNTSQTLSASGGSGTGVFSYSIVGQSATGVATLTGAVLTANSGTGWVDVQATRAANNNYNAVSSTTVRVTLKQAAQAALTFAPATTQTYNTSQTLSASGGSGTGVFSYSIVGQSATGVATLTGAVLTASSGTGWVDVQATRAANNNYNAVSSTTVRVTLKQAAQAALTFAPATTQTYNTSQTLSASGGSGAGVFSYAIVGQSATGVATLTGAVLKSMAGTGWVDVQATRAADNNYSAVSSTTVRVALKQAAQAALTFAPATTQTYNTSQTLSASGGSGTGTVSYSITNQSQAGVASLAGAVLKANLGLGWVEVQATKAADNNFQAATSAVVRVNVQKATQAALTINPQVPVTLEALSPLVYNTAKRLSTSGGSSSGLVTFAIVGQSAPGVASLLTQSVTEPINPALPEETWTHDVTSLRANSGTGWVDIQATMAADYYYYNAVSSPVVRVTLAKANQTLSCHGPSVFAVVQGWPYTVAAVGTGAGGYVWSGASLLVGSGSTATFTPSTAGNNVVTVTCPGDDNYNPISANTTVKVYSPTADSDSDGLPDWWELSNSLNPSDSADATASTGSDGSSALERYNLWSDLGLGSTNDSLYGPTAEQYHTDLKLADLKINVVAKGKGSVTLTICGESNELILNCTLNFDPLQSGEWMATPTTPGFIATLGTKYTVSVLSSGVTDFVISTKFGPKQSAFMRAAVELNETYADRIQKSEIKNDVFTLQAIPAASHAFASLDESKFEVTRTLSFGLGSSPSGKTAGMIMFYGGSSLGAENAASIRTMKGPAMIWSKQTSTHFQAQVPSGYVDVLQTRAVWSVRYYSPGVYPDISGFKDFSAATPVAGYEISPKTAYTGYGLRGFVIKRTIGGIAMQKDVELESTDELVSESGDNPLERNFSTTETLRHYGWHTPGTSGRGLTKVLATTGRLDLVYGSGVAIQHRPVVVTVAKYKGTSESDPIGFYKTMSFAESDFLLAGSDGGFLGLSGEQTRGAGEFFVPNIVMKALTTGADIALEPGITESIDTKAACTVTEPYAVVSVGGWPSPGYAPLNNLDGQSYLAVGETKRIWSTFGDERPSVSQGDFLNPKTTITSNGLVTTFSYYPYIVDGRAAVSEAVTKIGTTQVGRTTYTYSEGVLGSDKTIVTTSVAYASATSSLTTITKNFSRRLTKLDLRANPISIQRPDGTKTSFAYQRGTLSGTTWTADTNQNQPTGPDLLVVELSGKVPAAAGVTTYAGLTIDPLDLDPSRSTVTEKIINRDGNLTRESTYVYQTGGTFALLNRITCSYDVLQNLTSKVDASGRVLYEAHYIGFRKDWEKDEQGITLNYTYNDYGEVDTMKRTSATSGSTTITETVTTYKYDPAGFLNTETLSGAGETDLVSSYLYDTAGRLTSRTLPSSSQPTTFAYAPWDPHQNTEFRVQTTTTNPSGGTKVELLYCDGRTHSVTGTAVPDTVTTYAYDPVSGNLKTTQTTAGQTATTESDWLGRTLNAVAATWGDGITPGSRTTTNTYNTIGQLTAQKTTSGGVQIGLAHLYEYDLNGYGWLYREALDSNGNGIIDDATDLGLKQYEFAYQSSAPGDTSGQKLYRYDGVKVWPYADSNASTSRYASQTYVQLTGLSATTVAHVLALDFDRNQTDTTSTVDRAGKLLTSTTTATGTSQPIVQVSLNNLPIKSTNAQGQTTLMTYDGLGRLESSNDPRIGTSSIAYFPGTTLVESVTTPDLKTTRNTYNDAGRLSSQTNNNNKTAYFQYDAAGNLTHQWGDTVNPVWSEYNELGQKTKLHTYRSGTWTGATLPTGFGSAGDVTTWDYQAATGLLNFKQDAVSRTTRYRYDTMNRPSQRTDARNWVTNYTYTAAGQPWVTSYTDGITPSVTNTYDRAGRVKTVTDVSGTRTFDYYDTGTSDTDLLNKSARLKSETLPTYFGSHVLNYEYQYSVAGRVNGALSTFKLDTGTLYKVDYAYDAVARPNRITYNNMGFIYTYLDNSNLIDTITRENGSGYKRDYDYETNSNRLTTLKNQWSGLAAKTVETRVTYEPETGLRQTEQTAGTEYMTLLGRTAETGVHMDYSYTDRAELESSAKYQLAPDWTAGSMKTGTDRDYTYDPIGNRTTDIVAGVSGTYIPNALNQYLSAPGVSSFLYDENGNLTSDGTRTYSYDGENRLIKVTAGVNGWAYAYDYLGRRISKQTLKWNTSTASYQIKSEIRFLYDGWNLIAETDATGTINRRYGWGLDISGTLQGAGGVGGLLAIQFTTTYFPLYDVSHNVIGCYVNNGSLSAAYEYDPFGRLQTIAGSMGTANPFRSATKYTDNETGLVYYGMRYYSPTLGRFINRDPIEEAGGINLYAFCGNDGVNGYDLLGCWEPGDPVPEDYELTPDGKDLRLKTVDIRTRSAGQENRDLAAAAERNDRAFNAAILEEGLREDREAREAKERDSLPSLAEDIQNSFGRGSFFGPRTTVSVAPGGPTELADGTVLLPRVTVSVSRMTYFNYLHADSYALYGGMLNLLGIPMLGDLANAHYADTLGNIGGRNLSLAMAVVSGVLTAVPGGPSSRALGRNLAAAGNLRAAGNAAHHIVAGNAAAGAGARAILARFGIGINEAGNGVFLPMVQHWSVHTGRYYAAVESALLNAQTREEALAILEDIAQGLRNGTFP